MSQPEYGATRQYAEREHAANPAAQAHATKSNDPLWVLQHEFKHSLDTFNWYTTPGVALLVLAMAAWVVRRRWTRPAAGGQPQAG